VSHDDELLFLLTQAGEWPGCKALQQMHYTLLNSKTLPRSTTELAANKQAQRNDCAQASLNCLTLAFTNAFPVFERLLSASIWFAFVQATREAIRETIFGASTQIFIDSRGTSQSPSELLTCLIPLKMVLIEFSFVSPFSPVFNYWGNCL